MTNFCMQCCKCMRHIPTRVACMLIFFLQAGILDYYLVRHLSVYYAFIIIGDVIVAGLLTVAFILFYNHLRNATPERKKPKTSTRIGVMPISYACWGIYATCVCIKAGISFKQFSYLLKEDDFFGPNTMKTAFALGGVVYLLLLTTTHDAKPGSDRRKYIDELTGTVVFDILDCVDSMDILFSKEDRQTFPPGLVDAIIAIACINFLIPMIPLVTLAKTNYGIDKLPQRLVMIHKLALAFVVNLPLLAIRMILWHGLNRGISIFSLKNVIVIGMICYDFYEHFAEEKSKKYHNGNGKDESDDGSDSKLESYAMEDRFNY